ncbi:uncharacterized protein [Amphiura filiformis]|uniref:uncharacterized protein n=1 Tax=Amphiura filiformis TaxID=82378 RepID=UPI003B212641
MNSILCYFLLVAALSKSATSNDDSCCDSLVLDHKRDDLVYPLAWLPYIQRKIHFTIDADRDVMISLSKQTHSFDPRYLIVFQEDNSNRASIKRCTSNPPSFTCEDESYTPSSTPYLINGTSKHYWISQLSDDYTVQVGRGEDAKPFMSFTPSWSAEMSIRWIGLGTAVDERVKWQFCDLVVNEIAQHKPSFQSSNLYEGSITYDPSRANGYNSSLQLPGYCSQTAYIDIEPWWHVDLQAEYNIKIVRLWNNIDDTSHEMEGVAVYVSSMMSYTNQKIREQSKLCGAGEVTRYEAEKDSVIVRFCDYNKGRYVYLIKKAPTLKLCGVEVFGYQDPPSSKSSAKTSCSKYSNTSSNNGGSSNSVALSCVITILLIALMAGTGLVYYAYTHPSSNIGLFLLKFTGRFRNDNLPVATYTPIRPSNV